MKLVVTVNLSLNFINTQWDFLALRAFGTGGMLMCLGLRMMQLNGASGPLVMMLKLMIKDVFQWLLLVLEFVVRSKALCDRRN